MAPAAEYEVVNKDVYVPSAKDQEILDTPDHLFHRQTWDDLKIIIDENRLEDLKRVPSDLKRYLAWQADTRKQYGSIQRYILEERLYWDDIKPKNPIPFADEYTKILYNDWPYGLAPGIKHICVWTKAAIPVNETTGDMTPEGRKLIQDYIDKVFINGLNIDRRDLMWFKNWAALQSVRTVEHFHLLVNISDDEEKWMKALDTVAS